MTDQLTPGQVAYAAYRVAFGHYVLAWDTLTAREQRAWEAAAEAVLTQSRTAQGVKMHTLLEFILAHATPEDIGELHLWLSHSTASLYAELGQYPGEEPHA